MTASLMASLLLRRKRRVPVAPSVPSLRSSHDSVAHAFASLALQTARAPVAPSVPSLRLSRDGVANCAAPSASRSPCACGAVSLFDSLVTLRRRSLLRFSCVANAVCLWRRQSLRFNRHMTASLTASHFIRRKRRVPVAPSAPLLHQPHDGVAHCIASFALRTAYECGAVVSFASLVARQRRSLRRFSCVANAVCLWRRQSFASLVT